MSAMGKLRRTVSMQGMSLAGFEKAEMGDLEQILCEVMPVFLAIFMFLFVVDATHNHLGSSNGKFISFVDTMVNVFSYRHGLPDSSRSAVGALRTLRIIGSCLFIKFGAGTLVSMLLGKVPVIVQGPRHTASFFIGLALIWLAPGDFIFRYLRHSHAVRIVMLMGRGLYKMRKAIFAIEVAAGTVQEFARGYAFAFLLAVLAIDGSTLTRRGVHWMEKRLSSARQCKDKPLGDLTLARLRRDGCKGLRQAFLGTVLPLGAITAVVWGVSRAEWTNGITDTSFMNLRAALLVLFVWREGTFHELTLVHAESIHAESIRALSKEAREKSAPMETENCVASLAASVAEEPEPAAEPATADADALPARQGTKDPMEDAEEVIQHRGGPELLHKPLRRRRSGCATGVPGDIASLLQPRFASASR
mmetsp:Transcript_64129/g.137762  ORF Transcript_64129/g.137762 Transcript_64129/m.137762 type:complete len:419 (+) Transcript_64129:159-1415(+)